MKPVVFVDIDGTVADSFVWWIACYNDQYHTEHSIDDVTEYDVRNIFEHPISQFYHDYYGVQPVPYAIESLTELRNRFRIVFVTVGYGKEWLRLHLPFREEDFIHIADRSLLKGYALIDDNPSNLDVFQGVRFLVSQPWNRGRELNDVTWPEITKYLMEVTI